jgi:hypothetical protein
VARLEWSERERKRWVDYYLRADGALVGNVLAWKGGSIYGALVHANGQQRRSLGTFPTVIAAKGAVEQAAVAAVPRSKEASAKTPAPGATVSAEKPLEVLHMTRREAARYAAQVGPARVRQLLLRAQKDLNRRLKQTLATGAGEGSFTEARLRAALEQVRTVLADLRPGMQKAVVETGTQGAKAGASGAVQYLDAAEKRFKGVGRAPLAIDRARVMDRAVTGANASVLRRLAGDPNHPGQPGVLDRYGEQVVGYFEDELRLGQLTGQSPAEMQAAIVQKSPFLQAAPAYWATRIVRTETMSAANQAGHLAQRTLDEQLGGGTLRVLVATFDDRTGADSIAVHGQVRRMDEPFDYWDGTRFMAPPNRPNDREVVVTHRLEWGPLPKELQPRSEVTARWRAEGRKGAPPPRPRISTVPGFGDEPAAKKR